MDILITDITEMHAGNYADIPEKEQLQSLNSRKSGKGRLLTT
jgi:hypothetical protein